MSPTFPQSRKKNNNQNHRFPPPVLCNQVSLAFGFDALHLDDAIDVNRKRHRPLLADEVLELFSFSLFLTRVSCPLYSFRSIIAKERDGINKRYRLDDDIQQGKSRKNISIKSRVGHKKERNKKFSFSKEIEIDAIEHEKKEMHARKLFRQLHEIESILRVMPSHQLGLCPARLMMTVRMVETHLRLYGINRE